MGLSGYRESPYQKEEKMVIKSSGVSWTHLHTGVDDGHKYHQGQQHETGQVETQHEHGAGRREEVGILGGPSRKTTRTNDVSPLGPSPASRLQVLSALLHSSGGLGL